MDLSGEEVTYLSPDAICEINEAMYRAFGGLWTPPHNVRVPGALEYVIDEMSGKVFGRPLADSLIDKAALLTHSLITRHIFNDGNKRTALHAAWAFLSLNGVQVNLNPRSAEDLAVRVAQGLAGRADVARWLATTISQNSPN